jgi:hypothetical protein
MRRSKNEKLLSYDGNEESLLFSLIWVACSSLYLIIILLVVYLYLFFSSYSVFSHLSLLLLLPTEFFSICELSPPKITSITGGVE